MKSDDIKVGEEYACALTPRDWGRRHRLDRAPSEWEIRKVKVLAKGLNSFGRTPSSTYGSNNYVRVTWGVDGSERVVAPGQIRQLWGDYAAGQVTINVERAKVAAKRERADHDQRVQRKEAQAWLQEHFTVEERFDLFSSSIREAITSDSKYHAIRFDSLAELTDALRAAYEKGRAEVRVDA